MRRTGLQSFSIFRTTGTSITKAFSIRLNAHYRSSIIATLKEYLNISNIQFSLGSKNWNLECWFVKFLNSKHPCGFKAHPVMSLLFRFFKCCHGTIAVGRTNPRSKADSTFLGGLTEVKSHILYFPASHVSLLEDFSYFSHTKLGRPHEHNRLLT